MGSRHSGSPLIRCLRLFAANSSAALPTRRRPCYAPGSRMIETRIEELKALLPQCMLPDWVRLGRRLVRILRDTHHPAQRDALLERLTERIHASIALREERRL